MQDNERKNVVVASPMADGIYDISILLERARGLLNYMLDDGTYSWTMEHYAKDRYLELIHSFERDGVFLRIVQDYLDKIDDCVTELMKK